MCVPTYNEKRNIAALVRTIREKTAGLAVDILVIDSASPDGTAEVVTELQKQDAGLFLFRESSKLGLGKAYLDGMQWALKKEYDLLVTMDADFFYYLRYLRPLLEEASRHELVVGSRYIKGGRLENWPVRRLFLSRTSNWVARTLTALPFKDLTSGFQCFQMPLLKKILAHPIRTEGYAFQVELKFLAVHSGASFIEVPIVFSDRINGVSKISKSVILESMGFVIKLWAERGKTMRVLKERTKASGL